MSTTPNPSNVPSVPAAFATTTAQIFRSKLRVGPDGTATVAFRGQVADATRCFTGTGGNNRLALFAEVTPDDTTLTEIKVAVVGSGEPLPADPADATKPSVRLGTEMLAGGRFVHVFLLEVDGTADRAAHDAAYAARQAARQAQQGGGFGSI